MKQHLKDKVLKLTNIIDSTTSAAKIYSMEFKEDNEIDHTPEIMDAKISLTLDKISDDEYFEKISNLGVVPDWGNDTSEIKYTTISTSLVSQSFIINTPTNGSIVDDFVSAVVKNTTNTILKGINLDLDLSTSDDAHSKSHRLISKLLLAANVMYRELRQGPQHLIFLMHPDISSIIDGENFGGLNIQYTEHINSGEVYVYQKYEKGSMCDGFAIIEYNDYYCIKYPINQSSIMFKVKI